MESSKIVKHGVVMGAVLLALSLGSMAPAQQQTVIDGSGGAAPTVSATVDLSQKGASVPRHFLGFSMQSEVVQQYVGTGTTADPALLNLINNFDFYNSAPLKPRYGFVLQLKDLPMTLSASAASALNTVYSVSAFKGGLDIGTADFTAVLGHRRH